MAELQYSIAEQKTFSREEKLSFHTTDQPDRSFYPYSAHPDFCFCSSQRPGSHITYSFQSLSQNLFIFNFLSFFTICVVSDFSALHEACWEAAGKRERCLHVVLLPSSPPLLLSSSAYSPLVCFCG